ncbi:MAG: DEAD/DEAH box helicase [Nitrospiraceae bacterium]|nr:DEAD/DEAH box helicase [Nitrospiraceae bacterium]
MIINLNAPIKNLPRVGPIYIEKLEKLGLKTVQDLLFYFPFRYDDFSEVLPISELENKEGQTVSIKGKIIDIQNIRTKWKKMNLTEAVIEDESSCIKAIWFNQPFLIRNLKAGMNVSLSGKVAYTRDGLQLSNPAYEILGSSRELTHTARLVPVYHETEGLSSRWLRLHLKPLLKLADKINDWLPAEIIKSQNLIPFSEAIKKIHFPASENEAAQAKRRLAFNELFVIQLFIQKQRKNWQKNKAVQIEFEGEVEEKVKQFISGLPFKLTNAQRIAAWQILNDLNKPEPMNRLLEGDVGSGKTLVALIAGLAVATEKDNANYQTAIMAPTEILARQHFEEARERFKDFGIRVGLLTGSESRIENSFFRNSPNPLLQRENSERGVNKIRKPELIEKLKNGEIDIVIGTHALLQEKVSFKNLALIVIDEQHRFGIDQRAELQQKVIKVKDGLEATVPHLLTMTATPIPRTLALSVYGDLDLSILDEMPSGRREIITKLVAPANREKAYQFIKEQIKKGRQAFVICPLIDESDKLEVKSATQEYEKLSRKIFPDLKIGLLHGKLKPKEKEAVMKEFGEGKINILVSTSVVEVGIDVPNASVMMIEGSDRFGLAQLHQFRGRVGRSKYQSFCFLFTDSTAQKTHRRLKALLKNSSGFELAEQDLKIRGPGELAGVRQSGLPDLAMASLSDVELIKQARSEATRILNKNADLKSYPKLLNKLESFRDRVHFE